MLLLLSRWSYRGHARRGRNSALITRGAGARPEYARGDDWRQVENGLVAIAMDNRAQNWIVDEAEPELRDVRVALREAKRIVSGLDGTDVLNVQAIATYETDAKAKSVAQAVESLLVMARTMLDNTKIGDFANDNEEEKLVAMGMRYVEDLLRVCKVRRDGGVIELSAGSHGGLEWLAKGIMLDAGL